MTYSKFLLIATVIAAIGTPATGFAKTAAAAPTVPAKTTPQVDQIIHVGVNGMVCDFCAQTLKKTFKKQMSVQDIDISLEDKLLTVHLKPGQTLDDATIKKLVTDAGYAVTTIHRM